MADKHRPSRRKSRSSSKGSVSTKTCNFRVWCNARWREILGFAALLGVIETCLQKAGTIFEYVEKFINYLFICLYLLQKRNHIYVNSSS